MNDPLPPADPPAPSDLPWDALAAGELPPDEAEALRARAATDPSAEAARREAQAVEDALRAEPLLPLPLHLVGRVLAATAQPARIAPRVLLVRVSNAQRTVPLAT